MPKNTQEFKLRIPKAKYSIVRGCGFLFCRAAFMETTHVPEDQRKCFLVATKKLTEDSYGIERPHSVFIGLKQSNLSRIRNQYLYSETKEKLAGLYRQGYRAIHFEYEESA